VSGPLLRDMRPAADVYSRGSHEDRTAAGFENPHATFVTLSNQTGVLFRLSP
jgi:hypothetical protein